MTSRAQSGSSSEPLLVEPRKVRRVWGGPRFSEPGLPVGEVWLVHEDNRVTNGPNAGSTVGEVTAEFGRSLLGSRLTEWGEQAFPLLIKLIDSAEWLSIQVHPDDVQATRLEGQGTRGKTEAWYVLDAEPDAEIIAGLLPGVTPQTFERSLDGGSVLDLCQRMHVGAADALDLPAGTIHALGPGLFIYEIQQSSNLTYRAWDWNRPRSEGRQLHIAQTLEVTNLSARVEHRHVEGDTGELVEVARSPYFDLHLGVAGERPIRLDLRGEVFSVVTGIDGEWSITGDDWACIAQPFQSVIIPAFAGPFELQSSRPAKVLVAHPL